MELMVSKNDELNVTSIIIFICWFMATFSTLGSLFFSEIMKFAPCVLCWYQRIFMFPLVIIFFVGLFSQERNSAEQSVFKYSLPLVIIGWVISIYHNLLYYHLIPESVAPCQQGISCTTVYIKWFGFLTIPLLSLTSFTIILILLLCLYLSKKNGK